MTDGDQMGRRAERVRKLARCFAAEWLRPSDPDNATPAIVDTLSTAMVAFYACARSADERDVALAAMKAEGGE